MAATTAVMAFTVTATSTFTFSTATFVASAAAVSTATAVVAMASAATACVHILTVKSLCEFLFCSFADCKYLTLEVEGLTCHLVVEVHLYAVFSNLYYYARDNTAHAVHHRDGVADNEKVLADLAVNLECCLWKVDYP
jgi:hypothetical protein